MPKAASVVDSIIATLFVLVFLSISLGLNETVYSETDLTKRLSGNEANCVYNGLTLGKAAFGESDEIAREQLYGTFSARGAAISVYVLGAVALILGLVRKQVLELWNDFTVEIFNLVVTGAVLASSLLVIMTSLALTDQSYVPSAFVADDVRVLDNCKNADGDVIDNVVQRTERLQASLVFAIVTLFSIGYMARELNSYNKRKDKEEKEKSDEGKPLMAEEA